MSCAGEGRGVWVTGRGADERGKDGERRSANGWGRAEGRGEGGEGGEKLDMWGWVGEGRDELACKRVKECTMPLVSDSPSSSDGMDRTGTYICIASEVEHIRLEGSLDVFQSVKLARCQRPHLVSTEVCCLCVSVRVCRLAEQIATWGRETNFEHKPHANLFTKARHFDILRLNHRLFCTYILQLKKTLLGSNFCAF